MLIAVWHFHILRVPCHLIWFKDHNGRTSSWASLVISNDSCFLFVIKICLCGIAFLIYLSKYDCNPPVCQFGNETQFNTS